MNDCIFGVKCMCTQQILYKDFEAVFLNFLTLTLN